MPVKPTHKSGAKIAPQHVANLHAALTSAGLGGLKIDSMKLSPLTESATTADAGGPNCHAEQQPDGTWKIVCD
jgi:hypothetical protein